MLGIAAAIYAASLVFYVLLRGTIVESDASAGVSRPGAPFLAFAGFLVGMCLLVVLLEPVHLAERPSYEAVIETWRARLGVFALLPAVAGLASGLTGRSRPTATALAIAGPPAVYTAFAWIAFAYLTRIVPPDDPGLAAELRAYAVPGLTLLTLSPLIALTAAGASVRLGRGARSWILDGSSDVSATGGEPGRLRLRQRTGHPGGDTPGGPGAPAEPFHMAATRGFDEGPPGYAAAWADLRRRRLRFGAAVLSIFPLALLPLGAMAIPAWLTAVVATGLHAGRWPCPRCGKLYFIDEYDRFRMGPVTRWSTARCVHCDLRRGETETTTPTEPAGS